MKKYEIIYKGNKEELNTKEELNARLTEIERAESASAMLILTENTEARTQYTVYTSLREYRLAEIERGVAKRGKAYAEGYVAMCSLVRTM